MATGYVSFFLSLNLTQIRSQMTMGKRKPGENKKHTTIECSQNRNSTSIPQLNAVRIEVQQAVKIVPCRVQKVNIRRNTVTKIYKFKGKNIKLKPNSS